MVYYVHTDYLGSTSVLSDEGGQQAGDRVAYLPYGGVRLGDASTLPTDYGFTGQRLEAGLGLMHYGARFYSPRLGRFVSADTLVCHPRNPQAWNRYSYVLNNPLYYVDPTGHQQAAIGAVALVLELVDPLPLDPLVIPAAVTLIASDPSVQQALMYTSQHAQYYPAIAEQADTWVRAGEAAQQNARNYLDKGGNTGNADPNDPWRWGTNYRANYEEYYSLTRDLDYQVHHVLPKEWRDALAKAKINVDDPRWLREVQSNPSLGNLHQEYYTNRWGEFARNLQGRTPTPQEIVRFAQGLEQEYLERFGTAFYRQGTGMPGGIDWQALWNELNVGLQQGGMP